MSNPISQPGDRINLFTTKLSDEAQKKPISVNKYNSISGPIMELFGKAVKVIVQLESGLQEVFYVNKRSLTKQILLAGDIDKKNLTDKKIDDAYKSLFQTKDKPLFFETEAVRNLKIADKATSKEADQANPISQLKTTIESENRVRNQTKEKVKNEMREKIKSNFRGEIRDKFLTKKDLNEAINKEVALQLPIKDEDWKKGQRKLLTDFEEKSYWTDTALQKLNDNRETWLKNGTYEIERNKLIEEQLTEKLKANYDKRPALFEEISKNPFQNTGNEFQSFLMIAVNKEVAAREKQIEREVKKRLK